MSADIPAVALDVVRMERHVEPVGAHASCLVRAIRFAYRHREANRRDDRAGQRRQARRDRPFDPTAHVSDECISRIHIDVAHRKNPRPHGHAAGSKDTVSWHEDGARQVYDVARYYEILLIKNWCSFVIASKKETLPRHTVLGGSPRARGGLFARHAGVSQ
ncbi:hypothetical protein [Burkholderia seminalis]|uniref:Uncharacterized protein n=1 Tax=Burkholderia seminalis TaxID=488731 RepID=A0A8A8DEQ2_9BURK|nr:hypothetical protein [Burkholderia seminalis]QTO22950.1 hypothetical protein DT99_017170 [Burkholderia seminalis]